MVALVVLVETVAEVKAACAAVRLLLDMRCQLQASQCGLCQATASCICSTSTHTALSDGKRSTMGSASLQHATSSH
jgi:hypothetical protein